MHGKVSKNDAIKTLHKTKPNEFGMLNLNGTDVVCKLEANDDFRICLTLEMLEKLVIWYHVTTVHATGAQTLPHAMNRLCYHPKPSATINKVASISAHANHTRTNETGTLAQLYGAPE